MGEKWPIKFSLTITTYTGIVRDFLHAAKLRHGAGGFTSPPKEGMLRIFFARKIRRLRPGLNLRTRVPKPLFLSELIQLQYGRRQVMERMV
jgi:hypothetical protein